MEVPLERELGLDAQVGLNASSFLLLGFARASQTHGKGHVRPLKMQIGSLKFAKMYILAIHG